MPPTASAHDFDDVRKPTQAVALAEPGHYYEIGPATLLPVGHLLSQNAGQALARHAWACEGALRLEEGGRGHDHNGVAARRAPRLEQEGDIERHERHASRRLAAQKPLLASTYQGMDDPLKPRKRCFVVKYECAEGLTVDLAIVHDARESSGDGRDRRPAFPK